MSSRGAILLGELLTKIRPWFTHIRRATHASDLQVEPGAHAGEFALRIRGQGKDAPWEYTSVFSQGRVFGATYPMGPEAWAPHQRPCDFAREVIREVLTHRGFL